VTQAYGLERYGLYKYDRATEKWVKAGTHRVARAEHIHAGVKRRRSQSLDEHTEGKPLEETDEKPSVKKAKTEGKLSQKNPQPSRSLQIKG
jgi:hypothetical protein